MKAGVVMNLEADGESGVRADAFDRGNEAQVDAFGGAFGKGRKGQSDRDECEADHGAVTRWVEGLLQNGADDLR